MRKTIKRIIYYCHICKKNRCSILKSFYYSFLSKKIVKKSKSSLFLVDYDSKIHLSKGAKIEVEGVIVINSSIDDFSISSNIYLHNDSIWVCKGGVVHGTAISVWSNGLLATGSGFISNAMTRIMVEKNIVFGNNNVIARDCYFNDSNSHDIFYDDKKIVRQKNIAIGDNVWFCAKCNILKGVIIGNNVVIGACCVVTANISDNVVLIQKRNNSYINNATWKW